ncbi:MAG: hypothetical protein ABI680_14645, partial [Chthoniobacteraceae bacterium]
MVFLGPAPSSPSHANNQRSLDAKTSGRNLETATLRFHSTLPPLVVAFDGHGIEFMMSHYLVEPTACTPGAGW